MKLSTKKLFIRTSGLILICLIGLLLVFPAIKQKALDGRVKALLLDVQSALQNYHVKEEQYPAKAMAGRALVNLLEKEGFLSRQLHNPWTQGLYLDTDSSDDWLKYRTDEVAETYELITVIPGTDDPHYRLDSIENHSLEEN